MSKQTTLSGFEECIYSLALPAGNTPCVSLDGETPSGPSVARASRLATLEKEWLKMTSDTCGRSSETSLASVSLQSSLANRLRQRLDVDGSPEYRLIWKDWHIRLSLRICALRASRRRTSDNDCIGWRTPQANNGSSGSVSLEASHSRQVLTLQSQAMLTGWPSPMARDAKGKPSMKGEFHDQSSLPVKAELAEWPSASSRDHKDIPGMATNRKADGTGRDRFDQLARVAHLAGCATPNTCDATRGSPETDEDKRARGANVGKSLIDQTPLAGWHTPDTRPDAPNGQSHCKNVAPGLGNQAHGAITESSNAEMETPVGFLLNHRFSLWLQGYPVAWAEAGERARVGKSEESACLEGLETP